MADEEAEQAFFEAQAANADSIEPTVPEQKPSNNLDDNDEEDEYDPSKTLDDQYQEVQPETEHKDDTESAAAPNPTASSDTATGDVVDASDPSQNPHPEPAESQTSTPVPPSGASVQPQTKTIGGFVAEDDDGDDDEEADYEPPAALGMEDTNTMPMTMSGDSNSGNANQTSPDVSLQPSAQGSASVPDATNSSFSPAPVSNVDSSVPGPAQWASREASLQNSTAPTPVPDSSSPSRGRLPHDRVGILQDRIDEDPRGDIPAWLELIAEHRGRNRLDSAREVYEKFLKVFPMAVSSRSRPPNIDYLSSQMHNRPTSGSHMPRWSQSSMSSSAWSRFSIEPF